MKQLISYLTIVLSLTACSWSHHQRLLTPAEAKEDIEYWINTTVKAHPSSHLTEWRQSSRQHAEHWLAKQELINRQELGLFLNRINHELKDGHTQVNALADFWRSRHAGEPGFPFTLRYRNGQFVVNQTTVDLEHLRGRVVQSINGVKTNDLIGHFVPFVSGETEQKHFNQVGLQLPAYIDIYWPNQKHFQVQFEGQQLDVNLRPLQWSKATLPKADLTLKGSVAYLRLPSFFMPQAALKNYIQQIKSAPEITQVIIDIRNNGGGNAGLGFYLLRQLTDQTMTLGTKRWRYSDTYQRLNLSHHLRQKGLPPWLGLQYLLSMDWFIDAPETLGEWSQPQVSKIKGQCKNCQYKLYLVIDETVASAAIDLASLVKDNGVGVVLGQKTDGPASYYSEIAYVLLPNSGLTGQVASAIWTRPSGEQQDDGVEPDILITQNWSEQEWRTQLIAMLSQS